MAKIPFTGIDARDIAALRSVENYIEALRERLAEHDGCSRFGPMDSLLLRPYAEIPEAIKDAKAALVGRSNDVEHRALYRLIEVLGYAVPHCSCDGATIDDRHAEDCPSKAWEKEGE